MATRPAAAQKHRLIKYLGGLTDSLALVYDRLFTRPNRLRLERWVVTLGVAGFLSHLALIALSRTLTHPPAALAAVGRNYLSAIYTPFSFILFYEVLALVAAIPHSTVQSVASQFEIVSLIFVRGFFKDVAAVDDIGAVRQPSTVMIPAMTDVCASLLMFLLVTVFQHVSLSRRRADMAKAQTDELRLFIVRKKGVALALTVWLLALALYSLLEFARDSWSAIYHGRLTDLEPKTLFYTDVFSVMIFTDVLILILSLVVSDRYELVFRNAAFVISTILIRFSLTADRPYGALLGLLGMLFGIITMLIYSYNTNLLTRYPGSKRVGLEARGTETTSE